MKFSFHFKAKQNFVNNHYGDDIEVITCYPQESKIDTVKIIRKINNCDLSEILFVDYIKGNVEKLNNLGVCDVSIDEVGSIFPIKNDFQNLKNCIFNITLYIYLLKSEVANLCKICYTNPNIFCCLWNKQISEAQSSEQLKEDITMKTLNINSEVRIKLTPFGIKRLKENSYRLSTCNR